MKKKLKLLIAFALVAFCLVTVTFAKEFITIPTFNVEVNGYRVNSSYRQYPLIVYNEITYFPMTYTDARFLGIETEWDASTSTLEISKTGTSGAYQEQNSNSRNPYYDYAEKCSYNIIVNGKRIYNSREVYPLLMYRNVTYFPMTWRFAVDEFGWNYSFDNKFGLRIRNDGKSLTEISSAITYTNEELRPHYYLGNCKDMTKPVYVIVNFVQDNESKWTQAEADAFYQKLYEADSFFDREFAKYGTTFDAKYGSYGLDTPAKFNGTIQKNDDGYHSNPEIIDVMAKSLGFESINAMNKRLMEFSGRNQVIYIYAVNKAGRSYAINDRINDGNDKCEGTVIFTKYSDNVTELCSSSIAHEILHLFGAEDFYDPFGDYPNRKAYADKNLSSDIMLTIYTDINSNTVGDVTAFSTGITNNIPREIMSSEWWS